MNKAQVRAIYDQMVVAFASAVRSFTVVIDTSTEFSATGLSLVSQTMRHLFKGGPGQRYQMNLIARTDQFTDQDSAVVNETGLADRLTGLICTVAGTDYRIMAANTTPCGGLIRIALDSVEQGGI